MDRSAKGKIEADLDFEQKKAASKEAAHYIFGQFVIF